MRRIIGEFVFHTLETVGKIVFELLAWVFAVPLAIIALPFAIIFMLVMVVKWLKATYLDKFWDYCLQHGRTDV